MPAPHAARTRLTTGAVAAVLTALVGAVNAADPGRLRALAIAASATALAVVVVGLAAGFAASGPLTALLLGVGFVATRYADSRVVDTAVVPVAAALLLIAELAAWSAEARNAGLLGPPVRARLARLTALTGGSVAATLALAALARLPVRTDLANAALGVAAVGLVTGLATALLREAGRRRPT